MNSVLKYWDIKNFDVSSYGRDNLKMRKLLKTNEASNERSGLCTYT
jgi:hypothetical protein